MKHLIYYASLFFLITIVSCSNIPDEVELALTASGENKKELLKVINHYNSNSKDSLKLKAAYYLIANMPYHSFVEEPTMYQKFFDEVEVRREELKKTTDNFFKLKKLSLKYLKRSFDSINNIGISKGNTIIRDMEYVKADFIIENIDIAFKAYYKLPLNVRPNLSDFYDYVLPYRAANEPLEIGKRKKLFETFYWVYDSLKVKPYNDVLQDVYMVAKKALSTGVILPETYPYEMSLSHIEQSGVGKCGEIVSYLVNVYRALGIASGKDYVTNWGDDHRDFGHAWFFIKVKDNFTPYEVGGPNFRAIKNRYSHSSMPKTYRKLFRINKESTFNKLDEDVTHLYRKTVNLELELIWGKKENKDVSLNVFTPRKGWIQIDKAKKVVGEKAYFNNIGPNIIYLLQSKDQENNTIAGNYPFYLNENGIVNYLNPDQKLVDSAFITRKYPPFSIRRAKEKEKRILSINNLEIWSSNSIKPSSFKKIYDFDGFKTSQIVQRSFKNKKKYKYYKLISKERIDIARFMFLSSNMLYDKWSSVDFINNNNLILKKLTDDNQLTYIQKDKLEVIYYNEKAILIDGFEIQARNDGNHINIDHDYELLVWDKKWKSLGKKIAKDTVLIYKNIPKNGLYWLKNHTGGKEEYVFTLDENGRQFWAGSSEGIYQKFTNFDD